VLREVARRLDEFVIERNLEAREAGLPLTKPSVIRVMGQTALIEAGVKLTLAATRDVDCTFDLESGVEREFRRLVALEGRELEPLGAEIWMPSETAYEPLYEGRFVTVLIADADAVLLSKALKAPAKNRALITEYLARGASQRFMDLAAKYSLDLEVFL